MQHRRAAWLLTCLMLCTAPAVCVASTGELGSAAANWPADRLFDLAKRPKQKVLLTAAQDSPSDELMKQPLAARRAGGVLAELDAKQITDLCNLAATRPASEKNKDDGKGICVVHIAGPAGARRVAIEQYPDGAYVAVALDDAASAPARREALRPELVDRFLGNIGYLGSLDAAADDAGKQTAGEIFAVDKPYQTGPLLLDDITLRERLGFGGAVKYEAASRVLSKEKFWARLPAGYNVAKPAALLVWVDASPIGRPPRDLFEGLDQCGAVCIGAAESGNTRPVTERLQLVLDDITLRERLGFGGAVTYEAA